MKISVLILICFLSTIVYAQTEAGLTGLKPNSKSSRSSLRLPSNEDLSKILGALSEVQNQKGTTTNQGIGLGDFFGSDTGALKKKRISLEKKLKASDTNQ